MASGDQILVGGQMPVTLDDVSGLVKSAYMKMVTTAYNDAKNRGESLPPENEIFSMDGVQWSAP
jgi:hypothetical protein